MSQHAPALLQSIERLLVAIEQAVRGFARYHKYTLGTELRQAAMKLAQLAQRAWRDVNGRAQWLEALVWAVDDLRLALRLGSQLKAFASFGQYEALARAMAEVGKQVGGWKKQMHPKGQNPPVSPAQPAGGRERAQILSRQAASPREAKA
jgi:hypothetical protein